MSWPFVRRGGAASPLGVRDNVDVGRISCAAVYKVGMSLRTSTRSASLFMSPSGGGDWPSSEYPLKVQRKV